MQKKRFAKNLVSQFFCNDNVFKNNDKIKIELLIELFELQYENTDKKKMSLNLIMASSLLTCIFNKFYLQCIYQKK